ncbi:cytochrome P450 [Fodinicola feengrottensis]|nr:cytochrome P450 [Fodinicola feengrottensis]
MTWLLLFAGHETTARLLGNAIHALLTHPDQLRRLVAEPHLIGTAVEEFIRFDGPAENATFRVATEDIPLADAVIEKGSLVQIVLATANRDPRHFDRPEDLDIGRTDNHHLGMGHGIHYCLGASLARMEAEIAIGTLFRRFPHLTLAGEVPRLGPENPAFRGVSALPVLLHART